MMQKVEVLLPDELVKTLRSADVPISALCERTLGQVAGRVSVVQRVVERDFGDAEAEMRGLLTSRGFTVLQMARQFAWQEGSSAVHSGHMLDALVEEGTSLALFWLSVMEIDPDQISRLLLRSASIERNFHLNSDRIRFHHSAAQVLERALSEAISLGHQAVGCQHILLGLIADESGIAGPILRQLGADPRLVRDSAPFTREGQIQPPKKEDDLSFAADKPPKSGSPKNPEDELRRLSERVRSLEAILGVSYEE